MHKNPQNTHPVLLSASSSYQVQFNECDPIGIMWHGNYIKIFETGREAFSEKYDLDFMGMFQNGYATLIVHAELNYKRPLSYKDRAIIDAVFRNTDAAKIIFDYTVRSEATSEIICTGSTTQVFVHKESKQLMLTNPDFFVEWKSKQGI
jgi:acyl-CoA thioester hydrolase